MGNQASILDQFARNGTAVSGPSAGHWAGSRTWGCVVFCGKSLTKPTLAGGLLGGRLNESAGSDRRRAKLPRF